MEILVVIVIIGIFSSIAFSYYNTHQKRTIRSGVQAAMLTDMERGFYFYFRNRTYSGAGRAMVTTGYYPISGSTLYLISAEISDNNETITLIAKPVARLVMEGDGWICLNNKMQRSWSPGVNACQLSSTSTWYGE